jgi:DNA-binding CsgD family transcriptional regulator
MSGLRGGGFVASEVARLREVERALDRVPVGGSAHELFDSLAPVVPAVAGIIGSITPGAPEAFVSHPIRLPDEVFEAWMHTSPTELASLLGSILTSEDGALVHADEVIPFELRERLDVLRAFDAQGLGESAGYKVSSRPVAGHGAGLLMLALIAERGARIPRRSGDLLRALNPAIESALERLRVPLLPSRSIFAQVIAEQGLGYVCLSMSGGLVEVNGRAHELALRYQRAAGLSGRRKCLRDLAALALVKASPGRPWLLPDGAGAAILELSAHRLAKEAHALPEDVLLLMMKELRLQPLASAGDAAALLTQLTPRQREVATLLAKSALSFKRIADELGVTESTARKHAENLYRLLDVHSRAELCRLLEGASRG